MKSSDTDAIFKHGFSLRRSKCVKMPCHHSISNSHFPLEKSLLTLPRSCQEMKFILNRWPSIINGLSMLGLVCYECCSYPVGTTCRMRVKEEKCYMGFHTRALERQNSTCWWLIKPNGGILNYSNTSGLRRKLEGEDPSPGEAGGINTPDLCSGSCREHTLWNGVSSVHTYILLRYNYFFLR